jgi:excisionase family DNA binding protein
MLKPKEAAEALGVGRTQLYRLIKAKLIPSCRVGHSLRIPVTALRAWADEQSRTPEFTGNVPNAAPRFEKD